MLLGYTSTPIVHDFTTSTWGSLMTYKHLILIGIALLAAACGTVATPEWAVTRQATEVSQAGSEQNTVEPAAVPPTATLPPTATPLPPTATPEPPTSVPTQAAAAPTTAPAAGGDTSAIGDAAHGQELFNALQPQVGFACATCHRVDSEERLIGPGLKGLSQRAATRVAGMNALQYIYNSILNPGAYVVEGYPDNLMPRTFSQIFSTQDINDIVAYLLTL